MSDSSVRNSGDVPDRELIGEWVYFAENDFTAARLLFSAPPPRPLSGVQFHLQQAIEKLIKGVLLSKGITAPKTHDLEWLRELLEQQGVKFEADSVMLALLTAGAVDARYPGRRATEEDTASLLRLAESIWSQLRPLL